VTTGGMTVTATPAPTEPAELTELPVLDFVIPLAGFPEHRRFVLVRHDESGLLFDLRSLDDDSLSFVAIAPGPFFPAYAPEIDDATADTLGLTTAGDALVLALVTVGDEAASATANLKAPIVVNQRTRAAAQAVLVDPELAVRSPLRAA
jgi:flagellar assembly factor FliW